MEESLKTLRIHPDAGQFVCFELPAISLLLGIIVLAGWDGLLPGSLFWPLALAAMILALYLTYRYIYLTGMTFIISDEQIIHEHGLFSIQRDYIEIYRVVDYSEHRSFMQMLLGVKTVSIYSGDRTSPRLDIPGVGRNIDVISNLRMKVEYNKRLRNIHEFTNIQ